MHIEFDWKIKKKDGIECNSCFSTKLNLNITDIKKDSLYKTVWHADVHVQFWTKTVCEFLFNKNVKNLINK